MCYPHNCQSHHALFKVCADRRGNSNTGMQIRELNSRKEILAKNYSGFRERRDGMIHQSMRTDKILNQTVIPDAVGSVHVFRLKTFNQFFPGVVVPFFKSYTGHKPNTFNKSVAALLEKMTTGMILCNKRCYETLKQITFFDVHRVTHVIFKGLVVVHRFSTVLKSFQAIEYYTLLKENSHSDNRKP